MSQDLINLLIALGVVAVIFLWAYFTKRMQKDFSTTTWVLIPVAIAINIAIAASLI